jgi:acetoacetate decarboxylase
MKKKDILSLPSMPAASPSYPFGPYRFVNREYFIIVYESDPKAIRAAVPEPLEPVAENLVYYEWIRMPDSSGFGDYTESGVVIPCTYKKEPCNFVSQMYLDDDPPIAAGREIWGFPKKWGVPRLKVMKDTLTGTLHYDDERVAMGTMVYKHRSLADRLDAVADGIRKLNVNLKLVPDADGAAKVAQLVGYNLEEVHVHGA